jgi:hypothetical protein
MNDELVTMNDERGTMNHERSSDLGLSAETGLALKIAPNPASTQMTFTIEGLGEKGGMLLLFDPLGRMVRQQTVAADQRTIEWGIDSVEFPTGLYYVMLRSEYGSVTKPLTIHKL